MSVSPHTVITDDLAELRDALTGAARQVTPPKENPSPSGGSAPSIARMYSYLTGGKDHMAADRQAADSVLSEFPEVATIAMANRRFVTLAVAQVAEQGIGGFIDIGAGLPSRLNVHQVARRINPAAATCYVDSDEIVLAHAGALLAAGPNVTVAKGDLRDPAAILAHPALAGTIDVTRPVCLILASVLHFLEPGEADHTVATLAAAVAPGSYLILSAGTSTGTDPALLARLRSAYSPVSVVSARTEADIVAWFAGWDVLLPGLVDVRHWQPGPLPRRTRPYPTAGRFLAAVARKPSRDQP
ncbi:MAG TPA: SAM-dependent methyltransferase [Streptosporangiaceae bacterium]|nr:SAM-dependent methyltransferase [Streptosporangiaceae bacterium]